MRFEEIVYSLTDKKKSRSLTPISLESMFQSLKAINSQTYDLEKQNRCRLFKGPNNINRLTGSNLPDELLASIIDSKFTTAQRTSVSPRQRLFQNTIIVALRKGLIANSSCELGNSSYSFRKETVQHATGHEVLSESIQTFQIYFQLSQTSLFNMNLSSQKDMPLTMLGISHQIIQTSSSHSLYLGYVLTVKTLRPIKESITTLLVFRVWPNSFTIRQTNTFIKRCNRVAILLYQRKA